MKASALIVLGVLAAASCAAPPPPSPIPRSAPPSARAQPPPAAEPGSRSWWECVPYARQKSGIQLRGEAWTWWSQAKAKYQRGPEPRSGAVLVFQPFKGARLGHVAVVTQVLTDRIVLVSHANWGGSRGKIEEGVTMVDVSPAGDWSRVKVWYKPAGNLGGSVYPTYGFIYPTPVRSVETGVPHVEGGSSGRGGARPGGSDG
ncbi:CHAP domain-containing protein [Caulobacter sp. 17J80-11]|uniref:CHAP domain-containing protein n=1 Tax=Caulobacter sp. 17J80-11 TaxID=2763502 RepID=UPI0016535E3D|nr:CHAP domain-containing protein [Caulobacter sp. 17J80-11]MBC6980203.1 CHAP domain-containing protein [Caulobacter sp. 17J80-11]